MQFGNGYAAPLMIHAAIANGVFDALDGGAMLPEDLSAATGSSERGIRILLNGLTAIAVVVRNDDGTYALPPDTSAFLVKGKPDYQGAIFRHYATQVIPKWLDLEQIVRTGKPTAAVNTQEEGAEYFEQFVEALFPSSYPAARVLARELGLAEATSQIRVLDIAAGSGVWGIALAQSSPHVTVTALDWPNVLPVTKRIAEQHGVGERVTTIAGDLHVAEFGGPYDVVTLGQILHSEGEERSRKLLAKVHASLDHGGVVAIAEFVINEDRNGPVAPLIFSVNMLVNSDDGDAFTFGEMRGWLEQAGFADVRAVDAPGHSPLILATKP
jgi:2-polyprenyl-3-methyl-5-hydroxy-6-metoxy-1,4-benzoquinol methylase